MIAVVLFVVNYSRIDISKDKLTGSTYQSNMERPFEQRQLIKSMGESIFILRLQGFIFFGTSQSLVSQVNLRAKDTIAEKTALPHPGFSACHRPGCFRHL